MNIASDDDFWLVVGLLVGALRPKGPYAIGVINGEQGSAKSTFVRVVRALLDPNKASTRAYPRNEDDFYVAAVNGYVLSFDNVSYLSPRMADALCRLSTGGGFSKRRLYTDLEEIIVDVSRPVFLNGIPSIIFRPDLMDRTITLTLPSIGPEKRQTERAMARAFEKERPRILGALYDAVAAGLKCQDKVSLKSAPRMADLVEFMTAVEMGMGWEEGRFLRVYEAHQRQAMFDLAASDPLVQIIERVLNEGSYRGTAAVLFARILKQLGDRERWPAGVPRAPNRLSGALRRLAPALREMGIEVLLEDGRDEENRKLITIRRIDEDEF